MQAAYVEIREKVYFKSALTVYDKKYSQIVEKLIADGEERITLLTI